MKVSLAALAIVSLALIWLVIGIVRLRNKFDQIRAQQAVQEDRCDSKPNRTRPR